jgi:drug/metabolite transporter (DMT)-like permease
MTTTTTPDTRAGALAGITWMLVTGLLFVAVTGIVRYLGSDMPAVQAAFIRYLFGLILIAPILLRLRGNWPSRGMMRLYVLRGLFHGLAVMLWFYAMARIPIAEVTALGYTAPIFTTIGAALFLGERLHTRRILAVVAGFLGAIVILRPGFQTIEMGSIAQLAAAPLFAASFLLAKKMTRSESPAVIVAMLSIFCTLTLLPGALIEWRAPSAEELFLLLLTAVFATAGHYTLTRAFEAAPITVTQPAAFLQLVWAALLGLIVFGEPFDPWIFLGGGIVVAAVTYIAHREAVAAGRAQPKPGPH